MAIGHLNAEPVESKKYGRWVPQAAHQAGLAQAPRPRLETNLFYFAAPVVERRLVRRNMVGVKCASPWGESFPYHFATDALWDFEGCYVKVYFDPYDSPLAATLVLDQEHHGLKPGHVISTRAPVLEDAPEVLQLIEGTSAELNLSGLDRAIKMRKQIHAAIRTEYRALGFGGRAVARTSEARDGRGQRARIEISSQHSAFSDQPENTLTGRAERQPLIPSGRCPDPAALSLRPGQNLSRGAAGGPLEESSGRAFIPDSPPVRRALPKIRSRLELATA